MLFRLTLSIILFFSGQVLQSQNLTLSLTACYNFNGNTIDPINNINGGVVYSGVLNANNRFNVPNSALNTILTASTVLTFTNSSLLKPSNAISFSGWVKFNNHSPPFCRVLFTRNNQNVSSTSAIDAYQLILMYIAGGWRFVASKSGPVGTCSVSSTSTIQINNWYHVAFSIDNSTMKIFVNGQLENTVTTTFNGFDYNTLRPVILGTSDEINYLNNMYGVIDNVRFYDRTLTAAEVNLLYTQDPECFNYPPPPPDCNKFYGISEGALYSYNYSATSPTLIPVVVPPNATGLAVGSKFGFNAPDPTYWTTSGGTYWYFNGSQFINTNHSCGSGVTNIGASANFIYGHNPINGFVYGYNGSTSAVFVSTVMLGPTFMDIIGDTKDYYTLFQSINGGVLRKHKPNGLNVCESYFLTHPFTHQEGLAMRENTLVIYDYTGQTNTSSGWFYTGTINPLGGIVMTSNAGFIQPFLNDLGSCPNSTVIAPSISANPGTVISCSNPTIQLLTLQNIHGFYNFNWSTSNGSIVSTSFSTSIINAPGTYTVGVYNSCYNNTQYATIQITASSSPLNITISPSSNINCYPGNGVNLIATGGINYYWSPGLSLSAPIGSLVVANPSINTIYTVNATGTGTCIGTSSIAINVQPSPNIVPASDSLIICLGTSALLSASGGVSYTWQPGGAITSSINISPLSSNVYTVTGKGNNICVNTATINLEVLVCNNLDLFDTRMCKIYPKILKDNLIIENNIDNEEIRLEIFTTSGIKVYETILIDKKSRINLSHFENGVYYIKLNSKGELKLTTRVIKAS